MRLSRDEVASFCKIIDLFIQEGELKWKEKSHLLSVSLLAFRLYHAIPFIMPSRGCVSSKRSHISRADPIVKHIAFAYCLCCRNISLRICLRVSISLEYKHDLGEKI